MRKIFYLLGVLTIFNASIRAQGGATCTNITIFCTDEQNFLDTVETKLLETLKNQNIPIDVYSINPNDETDWGIRLTKGEIKDTKLPKNYLPTYKYQLVINWNSTLDTGYVLGFAKEYFYDLLEYTWYGNNIYQSPGSYYLPFYHVPLFEYKAFLSQKQMTRLYTIIKKNFINYISIDTVAQKQYLIPIKDTVLFCEMNSDTSSLSYQTLYFANNNSLVLMPLSFWVNRFKDWLFNWEITPYKEASCTNPIKNLRPDDTFDIYSQADTLKDEHGNKQPILHQCQLSSITVATWWNFEKINYNQPDDWVPKAMKITRFIKSISVNTKCNDNLYFPYDKRIWLRYIDIDSLSKKKGFHYYPIILDDALFRKLKLQYYKY